MKKQILFEKEARTKIINGVNILCNAVKSTLGAGGRLVLYQDYYGNPQITKDGVSVAKQIELTDATENMGASLVRQASIKTVQSAGDGTTTACVLAQAIINKGIEAIDNGANPIELIADIKASSIEIIKNIKAQSIDIKGDWNRVKQIAMTSTNGDEVHATLLVDAMQKIGENGVVIIEPGSGFETTVDIVKGIEFNEGYLSPHFVNNQKNECVLENPYIFLTVETITTMEEVLPVLQMVMEKQRPIIFISNNATGEGMAIIVKNRIAGNFPLCIVNAPNKADKRKEHLIDIATACGGNIFGIEFGKAMKDCKEADLGQAEKVIISKDKTIIMGGKGDSNAISERAESIKDAIAKETVESEKDWYKERLAKLSGGIAIMQIGGLSPASISETKDRCDDALCATKAAIEDGIVIGGGITYLNETLRNTPNPLMSSVLESPFRQILINAGYDPDKYISTFKQVKTNWDGINVRNGQMENFLETGIIDATRVTVSALENAVDVACLILQNNCCITNIEEPKPSRK